MACLCTQESVSFFFSTVQILWHNFHNKVAEIEIDSVFRIAGFYSIPFTERGKSRPPRKCGLCCGGACALLYVRLYLLVDLLFSPMLTF
jgi:hypothetical protein